MEMSRLGLTIRIIQIILSAVVIVFLSTLLFAFFSDRDARLAEASKTYEQCMEREYGKSPTAWYLEQGYYPPCDGSPSWLTWEDETVE